MICDQELFDISACFSRIRWDVKNSNNKEVVDKIINVLSIQKNENEIFSFNNIRKAISSIDNIDRDIWEFVFCENIYVHYTMVKDVHIYTLLIKSCELLKQAIDEGIDEKIDNLVDSIHCLPDIIAESHLKIPKSYWKSHVQYYRDKWDKEFLKNEQKVLKQTFKLWNVTKM